jgi:radical SAM protein with 4Fe4S-binding SPASM domain
MTNPPLFKKIYIEVSNLCNLQCTFCPEVLRPKKIMPLELFEKVIEEISPYTKTICLHLMGEPLLHPKFLRLLEVVQKTHLKINLTTNGILLKRYSSEILNCPSIEQVNFSLHSYFDNFPSGNLADYLGPILNFSREALTKRPDLYINFRLWNLVTLEQLNSPLSLNDKIMAEIFQHFQLPPLSKEQLKVGKYKGFKLIERIYLNFDTKFDWPSLKAPSFGESGFCYGGVSQLGIHADGSVVPCCLDKEANIEIGKIPHQAFSEILSSPRLQNLIEGFKQNKVKEELCQKCQFRTRFPLRRNTKL